MRSLPYANARFLIQQRALGTLAHELGNLTSPVALIADVVEHGNAGHAASAAGTLRLVATSLARATTICRLLRGNAAAGSLAPTTIPDTAAWWSLCTPFAADMLPDSTRLNGTVQKVALAMDQYESLVWATLACAGFLTLTRPTLAGLRVTGDVGTNGAFMLRLGTAAPRLTTTEPGTRQLLSLASWEVRRVGGRVRVSDGEAFECRITLPPTAGGALSSAAPAR